MSCYDWEKGELLLPAREAVAVKAAVRQEFNRCVDRVYGLCREFWQQRARRTRSLDRYEQALGEFGRESSRDPVENFAREQAYWILNQQLHRARAGSERLRQVTREDLARHGLPRATNRSQLLRVGEAQLEFDGRSLRYWSGENNHQVERAAGYPVIRAMFGALQRVQWTRGTGGSFWSSNEYQRESARESMGGGGSYLTRSYGPLGEQAQAAQMGLSLARYRRLYGTAGRRR